MFRFKHCIQISCYVVLSAFFYIAFRGEPPRCVEQIEWQLKGEVFDRHATFSGSLTYQGQAGLVRMCTKRLYEDEVCRTLQRENWVNIAVTNKIDPRNLDLSHANGRWYIYFHICFKLNNNPCINVERRTGQEIINRMAVADENSDPIAVRIGSPDDPKFRTVEIQGSSGACQTKSSSWFY